jgi:hypothetical protein
MSISGHGGEASETSIDGVVPRVCKLGDERRAPYPDRKRSPKPPVPARRLFRQLPHAIRKQSDQFDLDLYGDNRGSPLNVL